MPRQGGKTGRAHAGTFERIIQRRSTERRVDQKGVVVPHDARDLSVRQKLQNLHGART